MFWGGLGEGGSEDLPVRFGAVDARWCGVGGHVDAAVGAVVAAAGEGFSADEIANSACTPRPPSPWLEWPVLVLCGRELFRRSVCPEAVAAAVLPPGTEVVAAAVGAGGGVPLGVRSYPRERNRSPICNGTLSAGVCSLRLSGPEHLCIWA
jgi:hypothetical protein